MNLGGYFEEKRGVGVLSTADAKGRVAIALYARPHAMGPRTVAFIMADRLSRRNLRENPRAAYLFLEGGKGYRGVRLYLTRTREERESPMIAALRRRRTESPRGIRFLAFFRVDRVLPLVGAGARRRRAGAKRTA